MAKKPHRSGSPFADFPHDITTQILSRIPAKSLLRFMTVCKLWRSTICDPRFTELHRRCSQTRIGGSYFALLQRRRDMVTVKFKDHWRRKVPPPLELKYEYVFRRHVRGSSGVLAAPILNGLLCLHAVDYCCGSHIASIVNITTREILRLPETRFVGDCSYRYAIRYAIRYAMGYDPATEIYKVLRYGYCYKKDEDPTSEVFTLGTLSWRSTANPPKIIRNCRLHTSNCHNGTIYWLAIDGDDRFLISFNVGKEAYHITAKFSLPLLDDLSNLFTTLPLGARGNLAALRFCGLKEGIEVLNLEEDCDNNGELKVVAKKKIGFPSHPSVLITSVHVLGIGPTGEIVVQDDQNLRRAYYLDESKGSWRVKSFRCFDEFYAIDDLKTCQAETLLRLRQSS